MMENPRRALTGEDQEPLTVRSISLALVTAWTQPALIYLGWASSVTQHYDPTPVG